jgi:A/G-specific adenine glycosylase
MKYRSPFIKKGETFVKGLLYWHQTDNHRLMPWKGEKDPYKIWLSEIILQQTRVEQGLGYYNRFVEAFPTVQQLAAAPEQQVFKLWEGLGYYTRCKNLIATAKHIANERQGVFPSTYESILALKGVGPYTAAAIASFAYNLPHAVLDGNVFRVLSRIFDIELPIDTTEGKKYFAEQAQALLPQDKAGIYNQALMDFGATICKPQPECAQCFFKDACAAFELSKQAALPVKEKKLKIKERWFHYIVLQQGESIAIRQRTEKDIWQQLYDVVLIEGDKKWDKEHLLQQLHKSYSIHREQYEVISAAANTTQKLTHQTIHFSFVHLQLLEPVTLNGFNWISKQALSQYPFPKTLHAFLYSNL